MSLVRLLRAHALGHYTESFHDFGEFCCLSSVVFNALPFHWWSRNPLRPPCVGCVPPNTNCLFYHVVQRGCKLLVGGCSDIVIGERPYGRGAESTVTVSCVM
jgi:hypothetical protein